ncbi:aldo keto reductase family protein [Stylonychia lemnae]|uniref:Aldo keto reductase family protein n=1 Tax=Stylonychia lemnae TaxID=5949 RepID=A0A078AE02_STYLE|nr:aldo keto reductase family protein [Stylonychia lemnae]|eukprot:CDW80076.1 aldo keto reductase family protein [Stylonychia lemnae]
MEVNKATKMVYRYLGNSGLKVSALSFGNWLNSDAEENYEVTRDSIKRCLELGINFYDTAEIYNRGSAESLMGRAFKELNVRREDIVVSTKLWRVGDGVNDMFLSRKHLVEGMNNSLKRLQLDYVDVVFCHRPDYDTPLEETCRAMSYLIDSGKSFYWGTSMWTADRITKAVEICERLNLHKPITEQPSYSMVRRDLVEKEYRRLFSEYKYGTTIWSPLAGGILTGKYNEGIIPEGSRYDKHKDFLKDTWNAHFSEDKKEKTIKMLQGLAEIAKELGYTQSQLSLAWCLANQDISTVILGFTRLEQVDENIKALELYEKWTDELENKVNEVLGNNPEADMDWRKWAPQAGRRTQALIHH